MRAVKVGVILLIGFILLKVRLSDAVEALSTWYKGTFFHQRILGSAKTAPSIYLDETVLFSYGGFIKIQIL